jgi:hypothetical protein
MAPARKPDTSVPLKSGTGSQTRGRVPDRTAIADCIAIAGPPAAYP